MKTKNILKIGVLSIILLSLLISPVLKSNVFKVKAQETPCEEAKGTCVLKKLGTCAKQLGPGYVEESKFSCSVSSEFSNKKCCMLQSEVPIDDSGTRPAEEEKKRIKDASTTDATGTAKESNAAKICGELYGDPSIWSILNQSEDDTWWAHKVCLFQIGALEGIGKMIAGMINSLTADITWALNPDTYGGFVKNEGVVEIWGILRNFMNLALILILIIIAVSTILGIKKYRWQEILWKLVLIALLINFSLILPGVLLDISHFITYTFINLTQDLNDTNIAQSIMNLYLTDEISGTIKFSLSNDDTQNTIKVAGEDIKMSTDGWGLAWGNFFLILLALSLIGLFALITLIAIFFTTIFRSFMIIILLAVSPLAFAAWILPNTEKFWQIWWGQFIRWCLFPVTFAISLYAGIIVLNGMHAHLAEMGASNEKLGIIAMFVQIILFSMFLIGGLIVSIQSSGAVGKVVQKQVSRTGWLAGAFAARKTTGAIKESSTYKKAGKFLTKVPLLGGVGQEMMVAGEKAKAGRVKEHEKNLENVGLGNLKQLEKAQLPSPLDRNAYERRIALTNKLADMGELSQESVEFIKLHQGDERLNAAAITKAIPHHFQFNSEGQLVETGDSVTDKVDALSRIKPEKMKDKTQGSDFIKDYVTQKENEAKQANKSAQEVKDVGDKAFEQIVQEIAKKLSPAQMAAFYKSLSPKDLVKGGWGDANGKIVQAIKKDPQAEKRFYEELIPSSLTLREFSGIKIKKEKETKETPPIPGWTKKGGGKIWTP